MDRESYKWMQAKLEKADALIRKIDLNDAFMLAATNAQATRKTIDITTATIGPRLILTGDACEAYLVALRANKKQLEAELEKL